MTESAPAGTKMNRKKNWKHLRLSLKFRPEIFRLILKMRQTIRKRNSVIKSMKQKLQQMDKDRIDESTKESATKIDPTETTREDSISNSSAACIDTGKNTTKSTKESSTQTDITQSMGEKSVFKSNIPNNEAGWNRKELTPKEEKSIPNSNKTDAGWNLDQENGDKEMSIADQVKEVAQNAIKETGMVYVESAGMYYDYKTGYYYNSELGLYYHTDTNCYYYYSDEKQQFVFHSYPDTSAVNASLLAHQKKKARKLKRDRKPEDLIDNLTKTLAQDDGKPKRKRTKKNVPTDRKNKDVNQTTDSEITDTIVKESVDSGNKSVEGSEKKEENKELEDGECSDSESEISDCESDGSTSTASDEDSVSKHHPPCMRVIVRETNLPKLKVGSLFLITKDGGTVGREGEQHTILIKDHNVSRNHLDIRYDAVKKSYIVTDLGSKNGTILNGTRMSESQEISNNMEVLHGSTIQLGETKLLCHIHPGNDTCGHCEPGLLMETEEKEKKAAYTRTCSVQKQHQLELARLKNIYAPKLLEIEDKPYNDRAQARRETVGSTSHAEKTQTSDLDTSISQENKGFKLLEKMGWSKGEGLGKDNQGDTEPVPLVSNEGKAGLGTSGSSGPPQTVHTIKKINTLASATMRLASRTKMLQPPAKAFQNNDFDDESD